MNESLRYSTFISYLVFPMVRVASNLSSTCKTNWTEVSCIINFQKHNNALIKPHHQSWRYGVLTCIWLNVCFRSKSYFLHPTKKMKHKTWNMMLSTFSILSSKFPIKTGSLLGFSQVLNLFEYELFPLLRSFPQRYGTFALLCITGSVST